MTSTTIPMEDYKYEAFSKLAAENGVAIEEWALSLMEAALENHELSKLADEAYEEYLADPKTYTADEIEAMYL